MSEPTIHWYDTTQLAVFSFCCHFSLRSFHVVGLFHTWIFTHPRDDGLTKRFKEYTGVWSYFCNESNLSFSLTQMKPTLSKAFATCLLFWLDVRTNNALIQYHTTGSVLVLLPLQAEVFPCCSSISFFNIHPYSTWWSYKGIQGI